jgi:hypothetical protein
MLLYRLSSQQAWRTSPFFLEPSLIFSMPRKLAADAVLIMSACRGTPRLGKQCLRRMVRAKHRMRVRPLLGLSKLVSVFGELGGRCVRQN